MALCNLNLTPCEFMKQYSEETWEKLKRVNTTVKGRPKLKYDEVTVTQDLIYYFEKYCAKHNRKIKIFERKDEAKSGADIEVQIISSTTNYGFQGLFQAKRTYGYGEYSALAKPEGLSQLRRLILHHIRTGDPKPFYLFYNYAPGHLPHSYTDFGLTFTKALTIYSKYTNQAIPSRFHQWNPGDRPTFQRFLQDNIQNPFHVLFCPNTDSGNTKRLISSLGFPFNLAFNSLDFENAKFLSSTSNNVASIEKSLIEQGTVFETKEIKRELEQIGFKLKEPENDLDKLSLPEELNLLNSEMFKDYIVYGTRNFDSEEEKEERKSKRWLRFAYPPRFKVIIIND